jgi:F-type H+-transporting ATPase subunit b
MLASLVHAATTTATTVAAPTAQSKNPILPSTPELVWGSLSFLVVFLVMRLYAFPAVKKTMEARTERIRQSLDSADKAKADAQSVLDDYQRQLADAKNEANRIIEEARQTADQLRRDLMAKAETEATELRQRAAADIDAAKDRALADLRTQVTTLAIDLAEKVVERNLDRQTNTELVESYIRQVGSRG